jgi:hypothetical protein
MDIDEYIYSAISAGSSFWRTKSANHQAQGGGGGGNSGDGGDKKDDDSVDFGVPKSNGSITQDQTLLAPAHYSENEQIETRFMQLEERIRQLERERSLTPTPQNTPPTEVFPSLDATSDTSNANV